MLPWIYRKCTILRTDSYGNEGKVCPFQCPEETEQRFYEIWTGKESYLKYIGKGLGKSMQSFSVLADTQNRRLLHPIEGYTLTLYAADREYTFELLDLEQL